MSDELVILEKQKYLRDHVLDKGYSAENFVGFMQNMRGTPVPIVRVEGGDDLNQWTLEELKDMVDKFMKMQLASPGSAVIAEAVGETVDSEPPANGTAATQVPDISLEVQQVGV